MKEKKTCTPIFSDEDSDLHSMKWRFDQNGYARTTTHSRVNGVRSSVSIYAHRIVLSRKRGCELTPLEVCDHANTNKLDNRRENLRAVTKQQNCQNRSQNSYGASGIRGVTLHKQAGKWQAAVQHNGKYLYCGLHETPEAAGLAAATKRRELGFFGATPESAVKQ